MSLVTTSDFGKKGTSYNHQKIYLVNLMVVEDRSIPAAGECMEVYCHMDQANCVYIYLHYVLFCNKNQWENMPRCDWEKICFLRESVLSVEKMQRTCAWQGHLLKTLYYNGFSLDLYKTKKVSSLAWGNITRQSLAF